MQDLPNVGRILSFNSGITPLHPTILAITHTVFEDTKNNLVCNVGSFSSQVAQWPTEQCVKILGCCVSQNLYMSLFSWAASPEGL